MDVSLETLLLCVVTCLLAALVWLLWTQSTHRQVEQSGRGQANEVQDTPKATKEKTHYRDLPLDRNIIGVVQKSIGKSWVKLGREINISDADLETIGTYYQPNGMEEMAYQVLLKWQQQRPRTATIGTLIQHLEAIERKDLADQIAQMAVSQERSSHSSWFQPANHALSSSMGSLDHRTQFQYDPTIPYQQSHSYFQRPEGGDTHVIKGQSIQGSHSGNIIIGKQDIHQGPEDTETRKLKERRNQLLAQRQKSLKRQYQALTMKGLPWMEGNVLSLAEYYVELGMIRKDSKGKDLPTEPMNIVEIFKPVERSNFGEVPSRILIEGAPGFGKTTIASKLCFDWCKRLHYIEHFHLVLLLPLRYFSGDLEDALIKAIVGNTTLRSEDRDLLLSFLWDDKVQILVILDGFDELHKNQEVTILSLLKSETLPHVTVVLTSRPGKLSSNTADEVTLHADVGLDMNRLIHKRINIVGINETMQTVFVKKHTANFDQTTRSIVTENLKELTERKMLTTDFLKCPLFLLMIILLLTKTENLEQHAFKTRTELYKHVFNFVIRRYFSRKVDTRHTITNLFVFETDHLPTYVELVANLGAFAVGVLKVDSLSFTREDILETGQNIDPEILELGFLSQNVSVEGITERLIYEPVHKSLFEFAAAYSLWIAFQTQPLDHWEKQVRTIRPKEESAAGSLLFPFLAGLMEEKAGFLFNALKTYAPEYCNSFDSLMLSLLEVKRTESVITTLTPLLPLHWKVPWLNGNDNEFSQSIQHGMLLGHGITNHKIKTITWKCETPAQFPDDVEVEILFVELRGSVAPLSINQCRGFRCKHVKCTVFSDPHMRRGVDDKWDQLLELLTLITYQSISFRFISSFMWQAILYKSLTSGKLRHINMNWLQCFVSERQGHILDMLCDLLVGERIQSLDIENSSPSVLADMYNGPKPAFKSLSPLCDDRCRGSSCDTASQSGIDHIVECAAKSAYMNTLTIRSHEPGFPFVINIAKLCDSGHKTWNWLSFNGIQVICTDIFECECDIQHLDLTDAVITTSTVNVFHTCRVASLVCKTEFLIEAINCWPSWDFLREVNIRFDNSVSHPCFETTMNKLTSLSILIIIITAPQEAFQLDLKNWLLKFLNSKPLKRLELWDVETNLESTSQLLSAFTQCHAENDASNQAHSVQPKLHRLLLGMVLDDDHHSHPDEENQKISLFFSLIRNLKQSLQNQSVSHLEIACYSSFIKYVLNVRPENISYWTDIFPSMDGFTIEHDLLGSNESDSVHSKVKYDQGYGAERFSITFQQVT